MPQGIRWTRCSEICSDILADEQHQKKCQQKARIKDISANKKLASKIKSANTNRSASCEACVLEARRACTATRV